MRGSPRSASSEAAYVNFGGGYCCNGLQMSAITILLTIDRRRKGDQSNGGCDILQLPSSTAPDLEGAKVGGSALGKPRSLRGRDWPPESPTSPVGDAPR